GFPVKQSLSDRFDYQYLTDSIIHQIKEYCDKEGVPVPNIFSEFGSYTVAESGATLYSIIDQKKQNDVECWNMIDSSFITTLPDSWGTDQRFVLLAVNRWNSPYESVNLGGLTCDSQDYYNVETHANNIYLPEFRKDEPLYVGFFHTGAYQNELGGYGGIQHCLIPSPKQVIVYKNENDEVVSELFAEEQGPKDMLDKLGY
ncbi:MAG: arginine decarboxylase, partial [Flavobacteriales bacterium]|nr:arginine decarboxylase [Flavobacteriales bacterium]